MREIFYLKDALKIISNGFQITGAPSMNVFG